MLYLFYGPDTCRSSRRIADIVRRFEKLHGGKGSFRAFDFSSQEGGGREGVAEFLRHLEQQPIFAEKKLVLCKNATAREPLCKEFLDAMRAKPALARDRAAFVLFHEAELLPDSPLVEFVTQAGKVQKFPFLAGAKLRAWFVACGKEHGCVFTPEALEFFIDRAGNNLWLAEQEIAKIAAAVAGGGAHTPITADDIRAFVSEPSNSPTAFFPLADAVGERAAARALKLFFEYRESGASETELLAIIAWKVRDLLRVEAAESDERTRNNLRMHPFVLEKAWRNLRQWTKHELVELYAALFDIEAGIKLGALDGASALVGCLASLGRVTRGQGLARGGISSARQRVS